MTDRDRLIAIVKDSLIRNISKSCKLAENITDDLVNEGVMLPPCKVGDLVYVIRRKEKRNKGGYWNSICFTKKVMQAAIKDGTAYIDCKRATKTDNS